MPGLSLIYEKGLNRSLVANSLSDLKHEPYYEIEKLVDTSNMTAIFSGYDGYPRQAYESDNTVIFVEGLIYNKSEPEIEKSLIAMAKSYVENDDYSTLIKEFINTSDGEFIVLIYSKSPEKFVIFNDYWGRLPAFYYHDDNMFIFSREIKFILPFIPSIEFDKFSIAEWLVFEFVLGERTLVNGILKTMPSQMFNIEPSGSGLKVEIKRVFPLVFEEPLETLSRDECIEESKRLLLQSTNDRVNKLQERNFNITADLSGGHDTRAVFGGLIKSGAKVDYYTEHLATGDESKYALQIAALYGIKVTKIAAVHDMNLSDMSKVIYMTDCGVNGWTALPCYQDEVERLKHCKPRSVQFVGIGAGDFIKRLPKIENHYKTITNGVRAGRLVGFGSVEIACALVRLNEETFRHHLDEYFNQYPESTLAGNVVQWHLEYLHTMPAMGEDRGRIHNWIVESLWSKDFMIFATMVLPVKHVDKKFYFRFLQALDPDLTKVPIFSAKIIKNSQLSFFKDYLWNALQSIVLRLCHSSKIIKRLYKRYRRRTLHRDSSQQQIMERAILDYYAKLKRLSDFTDERNILDAFKDASATQLYRLATLILYFGEIECRYENKVYLNV